MSDEIMPPMATTYTLFENRGEGKLHMVQVYPSLVEAQRMARFHIMRAVNEGTLVGDIHIIRSVMTEVERVTQEDAERFQAAQEAGKNSDVVDFPAPKLII